MLAPLQQQITSSSTTRTRAPSARIRAKSVPFSESQLQLGNLSQKFVPYGSYKVCLHEMSYME